MITELTMIIGMQPSIGLRVSLDHGEGESGKIAKTKITRSGIEGSDQVRGRSSSVLQGNPTGSFSARHGGGAMGAR
jgi:hypothetical protein